MVLVDGNKYACETCIKGHRSSACRHTDRALFEIKKKGRPVTQCDNCRQLRKTKQLHAKCICEGKEGTSILPPAIKKGHTKIPDTATFPNGLPESQSYPEGASSESDNGGKRRGSGSCCMSRKSAHRRSRSRSASRTRLTKADSSTVKLTETGTQSSGRLAELRPVLPRPSRPLHTLTSDFTQYYPRHHSQENLLLNQAHNIVHPYNIFRNRSVPNMVVRDNVSMPAPPILSEERKFQTQYPSVCGCGDTCSCLRCPQHNNTGPSSTGGYNPCPDCAILSLAADTSLSIFDAYPATSIDEWTMQISSLPRDSSGITLQQQDVWDNYLAPITEPPPNNEGKYSIQPCCGVFCKCSPETCECDIDREDGYDCRKESLLLDSISMLSVSDEHVAFDGIMTSQPVGAIDSGPGSWDIPNFPPFPAASARSRSLSLSFSSSSSRSSYPLSSDFDVFNPIDDFASQPFASLSLPDLGHSLQPRLLSRMRNTTTANMPWHLDGGVNRSQLPS